MFKTAGPIARIVTAFGALVVLAGCGGPNATQPAVSQTAPRATPTPPSTIVEQPDPDQPILVDDQDSDAMSGRALLDSTGDEEVSPLKLIHFEYDQARITDEGKAMLQANANYLRERANTYVRVEGHCDERGSIEYNQALGERRANSAKQFLVALGIDSARLDTISYGEDRPLAFEQNEYAWALNRRVEFRILSE